MKERRKERERRGQRVGYIRKRERGGESKTHINKNREEGKL